MASFEWMELQSLTHDITESRTRLSAARASKDSRLSRQLEEEISAAEQRRTRLLARITNHLAAPPEGGQPADAGGAANSQPDDAAGTSVEAAPEKAVKTEARSAPRPEPLKQSVVEEPLVEVSAAEPGGDEPQATSPEEPPVPAPEEPQATAAEEPPVPAPEKPQATAAEEPPVPAPEKPQATAAEEAPISAPEELQVAPPPEEPDPAAAPARIVASERRTAPAVARPQNAEGDMSVWDKLTPSDLDRAKQELVARRAETLARHADELRALDSDQTELDTLDQAISTFLAKFNKSSVVKFDQERELRKDAS